MCNTSEQCTSVVLGEDVARYIAVHGEVHRERREGSRAARCGVWENRKLSEERQRVHMVGGR
jgi:hypothetical protein